VAPLPISAPAASDAATKLRREMDWDSSFDMGCGFGGEMRDSTVLSRTFRRRAEDETLGGPAGDIVLAGPLVSGGIVVWRRRKGKKGAAKR